MQMILLVIYLMLVASIMLGAMFVGIYVYRLGYKDGDNGNVKSAILPQIPKKPKLSRAQLEKIEEQRKLRREGFNNMIKYMNGED